MHHGKSVADRIFGCYDWLAKMRSATDFPRYIFGVGASLVNVVSRGTPKTGVLAYLGRRLWPKSVKN